MILTCYYCNKSLPKDQLKRCARCLLVTYCSKECQAKSWKASHKFNCNIHPFNASPSKPGEVASKAERPAKHSPEWVERELDRSLSRWLELWRSSFCTWTRIALDLANHPVDRVMTHCMRLVVEPRESEHDHAKDYQIVNAAVVTIASIEAKFPELDVHIDPTDFTRFRFVVVLQIEGEVRRVRLVQWNDLNAEKWRTMSKDSSASSAADWMHTLIFAVDNMSPRELDAMVGRKKIT
ncbi:hypothetical protein GALMADRAFT_159931 [Galerina marginata CBS 339.88]|uniref:MYND-type domain-containing protein n=1 Tax=Galerina marginata (strain CBS 339.88) TaxID=685588 RepID=A0A067SHU1_GALM3|nr:hypothetical protein GALMADRAFT_159931 [Galerina marginata CBS 339.88]